MNLIKFVEFKIDLTTSKFKSLLKMSNDVKNFQTFESISSISCFKDLRSCDVILTEHVPGLLDDVVVVQILFRHVL